MSHKPFCVFSFSLSLLFCWCFCFNCCYCSWSVFRCFWFVCVNFAITTTTTTKRNVHKRSLNCFCSSHSFSSSFFILFLLISITQFFWVGFIRLKRVRVREKKRGIKVWILSHENIWLYFCFNFYIVLLLFSVSDFLKDSHFLRFNYVFF